MESTPIFNTRSRKPRNRYIILLCSTVTLSFYRSPTLKKATSNEWQAALCWRLPFVLFLLLFCVGMLSCVFSLCTGNVEVGVLSLSPAAIPSKNERTRMVMRKYRLSQEGGRLVDV